MEGNHVWNAGIFLFRADAYLAALNRHHPETLVVVAGSGERTDRHVFPNRQALAACLSESVDYAIMEREARVACVPVNMGWSDVRSWDSLHAISTKDLDGNAVRGHGLALGTNNCLIHTDGPRITLVDMDDLIVVV